MSGGTSCKLQFFFISVLNASDASFQDMHVWHCLAIAIYACPKILIGLDHLVVLMVPYGLGIDVICIYIKIHHERSISLAGLHG